MLQSPKRSRWLTHYPIDAESEAGIALLSACRNEFEMVGFAYCRNLSCQTPAALADEAVGSRGRAYFVTARITPSDRCRPGSLPEDVTQRQEATPSAQSLMTIFPRMDC